MADHAAPVSTFADALNRAWRTLYVAIGLDALGLIGLGLTDLLTDANVDVTSGAFWALVGVLVLKSVLTSLASFLLRLKVTPHPEATAKAVGLDR